jgi:formate dehydrogenase iron-sulfur subunit
MIVVEMWIARAWKRRVAMSQLESLGKITFWARVVYFAFRLGDMAYRQQLAGAFSGRYGALFLTELIAGGVVPLVILGTPQLRSQKYPLFAGALLTTLGIVFNRINVVLLAMDLRGPMPQSFPEFYSPTIFEWGISVGLIAATIFLFGLAARLMPVLPKDHPPEAVAASA